MRTVLSFYPLAIGIGVSQANEIVSVAKIDPAITEAVRVFDATPHIKKQISDANQNNCESGNNRRRNGGEAIVRANPTKGANRFAPDDATINGAIVVFGLLAGLLFVCWIVP